MLPGHESNGENLGKIFFDLLYNNGMLNELIRIASITYKFMIKEESFHKYMYVFSAAIGKIS